MSVNGLLKATARVLDLVSVGQRQPQGKNHQLDTVGLMNAPYPANWIKERLGDWASEKGMFVGSVVPEGFEAYARVFHPAELWKADRSWEQVRWSTVASWNGKVVHPQMQFCRIANLDVHLHEKLSWGRIPFYGMLPEGECQVLISVLKGFTSTPERCYFSLWHGYGFLDDRYFKRVAKLKVPRREEYLVFCGPLDSIMSFYKHVGGRWGQSPNIWWPEDRAWCVATEIDSLDTYIGGSKACIERVLGHPDLEALPIGLGARVDASGDTINV